MKHTTAILSIMAAAVLGTACQNTVLPEMHETVTIDGDHGHLIGNIDRPEIHGEKAPVAIIYHGLTGWRDELHNNAVRDSLYAHGVATVCFDFNGHGESEGRFIDMTLDNEIVDAKCIFNYVSSLPWVDTTRIAIMGHSQGGLVTSVVAGDLGFPKVRCAVLLAPAAFIHDIVVKGEFFGRSFDPSSIETLPDSLQLKPGYTIGKEYLISASGLDVYGRCSHYDGPVCVIQGLKDTPALIDGAAKYQQYLKHCEYHTIEGLTHCFPEDRDTPARLTKEFVLPLLGL